MKKQLLVFIFFLVLSSSVYALDCQYTTNNPYTQEVKVFVVDGEILDYNLLEAKDFIMGDYSTWYGTWNPKPNFKVYNNYKEEINVTVSYIYYGKSKSSTILIDPGGYNAVVYDSDPNRDRTFDPETINYEIHTEGLEYKTELKTFDNYICKICPNGKQCLDDGASCDSLYDDSKCGSGICNIAGFCGKTKVVDCPNGLMNCNDKICLEASTKKAGEGYSCDWECASGRSNGEKCLKSISEWVYWIIGVSIITILIIMLIRYFIKKGPLTKKIKELENKVIQLEYQFNNKEKDIKELEKKGVDLKEIIEENEKLINIGNNQINSLKEIIELKKEELGNIGGKLKSQTENELRKLKNQLEEIKKINTLLTKENRTKEKELKRKEDSAIKKYGGEKKVFINEEGYIQFKSNLSNKGERGPEYHHWLYVNKLGIGTNKHIHHIDGNKLNNEMWNLMAIEGDVHRYDVKEARIKNEGWEEGLLYLLDNGFVKEENIHRYIKEHWKELESKKGKRSNDSRKPKFYHN